MAGDGSSAQSPLTVSQALAKKNDQKSYYVSGYIVGEYRDYSNNKHFYYLAPPFDGTSAYLIADDVDEMDLSRMMPVQIKDYVDNIHISDYYTPSAVTATSTEATTRLWGTQGTLCFEASQPVNLRIHTLDGTLVSEQHIAGHGSLPLPAGFYLVSTPTSTVKVVVR